MKLGTPVYEARIDIEEKRVKCPECKGTGSIDYAYGDSKSISRSCHRCYGNGRIDTPSKMLVEVKVGIIVEVGLYKDGFIYGANNSKNGLRDKSKYNAISRYGSGVNINTTTVKKLMSKIDIEAKSLAENLKVKNTAIPIKVKEIIVVAINECNLRLGKSGFDLPAKYRVML